MRADRCIADADILVDIAHVLMLDRRKIIGHDVARQLLPELIRLNHNGVPEEAFEEKFEDVHAGIESLLIESLGADIGGRMHMGRSRNDEVATCIRITLRDALLDQLDSLIKLRRVLIALASNHINTVMPGFTHFQHAQPTTLAHHLLAYEQAFSRDFDRLNEAYARVNQSPLGAAAFASTGYPIDREFTASLLGFDDLITNTMDAVATRDFALETLADLSILMTNASRFCEELIIWSSSFVKFVTLDDAVCSTSSIMPQKKNPDTAEIMRAKTGSVFGAFSSALIITKGLPMSYNRDLQELTPALWRAIQDARMSLNLLSDMLAGASFDAERMQDEAGKGFSTATELADTLVREYDIPFRTAHTIVGRAVQKGDLSLSTLKSAAQEVGGGITLDGRGLTQTKIDTVLNVNYSIDLRKAPGGPAPHIMRAAVDERKKQVDADSALISRKREKISKAKKDLISRARKVIA